MSYSGFCKKCQTYHPAPPDYKDDNKRFLTCPMCKGDMSLDRHSIDELKKLIGLSKSEIGPTAGSRLIRKEEW